MNQNYRLKYKLSDKQRELFESDARFRVAMAGRRFGKNEVETAAEVDYALNPDEYSFGPDDPEDVLIWHVAPTYRQAYRHGYKKVLEKLPKEWVADDGGSEYSPSYVELDTGAKLEFLSYDNPEGLQGEGVDLLCGDEWAYSKSEIWDADLRPMLLDSGGGAVLISKPLGENHFFKKYQRGADPGKKYSDGEAADPEWYSIHATSYDNPLIDPSELDELQANTPEQIFRREYLADPRSGGSVYNRDMFDIIPPHEVISDQTSDWWHTIIAVDPAVQPDSAKAEAQDSDFWSVTVCDVYTLDKQIYVTDTEKRRGMDLTEGVEWLAAIYNQVNNAQMIVEANQAQTYLVSALNERGISVTGKVSTTNKEARLTDLSIPIANSTVKFVDWNHDDPEQNHPYQDLIQEALAFPNGDHDDSLDSLWLAVKHSPVSTSSGISTVDGWNQDDE